MARFVLNKPLRQKMIGTPDDDLVTGSRRRPWIEVRRGGLLRLLDGNNKVIGRVPDTGGGSEPAAESSAFAGISVLNYGQISSGDSDDLVKGVSAPGRFKRGIYGYDGRIRTGGGDDRIIGRSDGIAIGWCGSLETGSGDDLIKGRQGVRLTHPWIGMHVTMGFVNTGKGDDRIVAYGRLAGLVLDDGGLTTGKGNDTVDVRHGGLATGYASEPLNLGPGDDRFIGFAAKPSSFGWGTQEPASVRGGRGTDTLVLPPGTYRIDGNAVVGAHNTLMASGFESLEAFGGGARPFSDGHFLVDNTSITALG